ncbi:MAG: hypothetical protein DSY40_00640 [Nautilia sp.]|nr:MAG: hypothetical protein DSY40_00640 [Nautilia sp.]
MKKYLVLAVLGTSLFAQSQFIQKYNVDLNIETNQVLLNQITNLNKEVKNNKKCEIKENIKYTKNDKYPYNITLNISCNTKDNKDMKNIKKAINKIVSSKDVKITEYATQTYQASEEHYKNEKEFYEKHKDAIEAIEKLNRMQQKMQEEMQRDFEQMQQLFR